MASTGGDYKVYLMPPGTPQRKMRDHLLGAAKAVEAKALAERHFD